MSKEEHRDEERGEPDVSHRYSRNGEVLAQIDRLQSAIDEAVAAYREKVKREAVAVLADVLLEASAAHGKLLDDSLGGQSEHVRSYRAGLRSQVVEPLIKRLESVRPAAALQRAHDRLLDALSSAAGGVDEEVVRPEPPDLFEPLASDSRLRRIRKNGVRVGRRLTRMRREVEKRMRRLTKRPYRERDGHLQHVPLRRLATFHVQIRLPLELQLEHEAVCRAIGETLAVTARAVTEHVHVVLEAERRRDAEVGRANKDEAGTGETPEGAEHQRDEAAASLYDHGARLNETFRNAAERLVAYDGLDRVGEQAAAVREQLERDAYESDSFMLDTSRRGVDRGAAVRRLADERDARWVAYQDRALARIEMMDHLLGLRQTSTALAGELVNDVLKDVIDPVHAALDTAERALDKLSGRAKKDLMEEATADDVRRHLRSALNVIEDDVLAVLGDARPAQTMRHARDDASERLAAAVQSLPQQLEVNVLDERDEVDPERVPKRVDLREHAARAYDALLVEKLHKAADGLARVVSAARDEAESVPGILRFNLGTALEDLESGSDAATQDAARELVVDGLARSADVIGAASAAVGEQVDPFKQQIDDVFETGFASLHERVRIEERVREQILDLRAEAEAGVRQTGARAAEQARRAAIVARKAYRTGLRRAGEWVRAGREAAGLAVATEEERYATLDVLADTDRVLDGLPLVYRRLFTFDPVRDPTLLEGRQPELQIVQQHVERWKRGLTNALLLVGFHGTGHTSLLNVLRQTVLEGASIRQLDLTRRLRTEEELVDVLKSALSVSDCSADTLDHLAEFLFSVEGGDRLPVCMVEHLEHLYLRQIGGTDLAEAFLTFMSRTDSRMLWIVTASDYGWQIIRKAEPAASGLAVVQPISPVTREGLEAIVLNRHRRSGLPLRFEAPATTANPILARRLRRAQTEQERQDILRSDYFDRLQRACGQNIMLGLLYWLRSTAMDEEAGLLRVQPVEPLSFSFLHALDLDQAFTLKAMLEHASLTVEEHGELFLIPVPRSLEIFEALGNLLLIEPVDRERVRSRFAFSTVEEGVRYRVRPLLIHPLIQYLRGKNILH